MGAYHRAGFGRYQRGKLSIVYVALPVRRGKAKLNVSLGLKPIKRPEHGIMLKIRAYGLVPFAYDA